MLLDRLQQHEIRRQPGFRQWSGKRRRKWIEIAPAHQFETVARAREVRRNGLEQPRLRRRGPEGCIDGNHHQRRHQNSVESICRTPTDLSGLENADIHSSDRSYGHQGKRQKEPSIREQIGDQRKYDKEKGQYETGGVQQFAGYRHDRGLHRRRTGDSYSSLEKTERDSGLADSKGEQRSERPKYLHRG